MCGTLWFIRDFHVCIATIFLGDYSIYHSSHFIIYATLVYAVTDNALVLIVNICTFLIIRKSK